MKPKVLILGGGMHQIPCIEQARKNYEVHCIDYLTDSPGHDAAHHSYLTSTRDVDEVLRIAREQAIAGILSPGTDVAVPTKARVAEALSLPGVSVAAAEIMTNKSLLHGFLRDHGFPVPQHFSQQAWQHLPAVSKEGRWIVKPTCSSGSKGIRVSSDPEELVQGLAQAANISLDGNAVIEEFLEGRQYTAEGFLTEGRFGFLTLTQRLPAPLPHAATHGHIIPAPDEGAIRTQVQDLLDRLFQKLKYATGPFDCDFVVRDSSIYILEVSPRLGGNFLSPGIRHSHGVDLVEANLRFACTGSVPALELKRPPQPVYVMVFGVPEPGKLHVDFEALEQLRQQEGVREARLFVEQDEVVYAHTDGRGCLGYAIVDAPAGQDFRTTRETFMQHIGLRSQP